MVRVGAELCPSSGSAAASVAAPHVANRRSYSVVLLILLLCAFSSLSIAQTLPPTTADDQAGEQAYMSYHGGDIDSISLSNGSLSLNFPFLSYPQRGKLHVSYNLMYHDSPQHQGYLCITAAGKTNCTWTWGYGAVCCALGVTWAQDLQLHGQSISKVTGTGDGQTTWYYSNVALQMPDGSRHPLGNLGTISWTPSSSPCTNVSKGYVTCEIQSGPFETLDGTGWRVNGSIEACPTEAIPLGCYLGLSQAVDPDGVIYGNGTIQDPNGNEVTSSSTGIVDSLGRQIPSPPTASGTQVAPTNCPVVSYPPGIASIAASYAVLWSPPGFDGGNNQYTFCYAKIPTTIAYFTSNQDLLQSIVLPNGQSWQFQYYDSDGTNNFATLSQITLPTGGTISYTYTYGGQYQDTLVQDYGRWVATRTVNDGTGAHTWTYTYSNPDTVGGTTTVTDPLGNAVVHTFSFGNQYATYETETEYYQGSPSPANLLKTVNTAYSSLSDHWQSNAPLNVVPTSITTVWPGSQTTAVAKTYDAGFSYTDYLDNTGESGLYGKVVAENDYDYPSGTSLLRTTNTVYLWQSLSGNSNYATYLSNNLLNLPYSIQTLNGTGTQMAYTSYGYDESGYSEPSGVTEQKVAGETDPGNQTSVHRWLNGSTTATTNCIVSNGSVVSHNYIYDTGELAQSVDPCSYSTTYGYSSTYYGAFPTTVTNALSQVTTYGYDFNTGAVTSIEDPNLQTTTKTYDILTRLTSVTYPDTGSTSYCYTDMGGATCTEAGAPYKVVITKAITSSLPETSTVVFDGLGRVSQTQLTSDPKGTTYTLTTYDADGRKSQVYNPTRCSSITTNCESETTWGYSTTNYDGLSRVTSVAEQDGSVVSTSYAAFPCTTVTDEAGHARESCVDGLGRMTSVLEDPGTSPHLNYQTLYQYDALSDLTNVTQNGSSSSLARVRNFSYDSLTHLTKAVNPESGTISYAYDADGNAITKTAPSPNQASTGTATVVTTYAYDKLNRLTGKSYVDSDTSNPATVGASYGYDGVALTGCNTTPPALTDSYPKGRRTAMCDGSGATSWNHDTMGRALTEKRNIDGITQAISYTYNLDGSIATLTYPDTGEVITYAMGGDGRPTAAQDNNSINYVESATYAPPGQLTGALYGKTASFTGITITNAYNDRLQPLLLSETNPSGTAFFGLCYDFHLGVAINTPPCSFSKYTTGDNGNVFTIQNNGTTGRTQSFTYDVLNRISTAQSSANYWGEAYTIDAWGNLTTISQISGKTNFENLSEPVGTNNQFASSSGFSYDAAGNFTSSGTSGMSFKYDAENRLVYTSAAYTYYYDGDGNRVAKSNGTSSTVYWRDRSGNTLLESSLTGTNLEAYIFFNGSRVARLDVSTGNVNYYFSDQVGSHGVVVTANGSQCEQDIDYYAYGGVMSDWCPAEQQHYRFNGKERDTESGLDNFGARYNNSALGRFMTPDWAAKPVNVPYANFGNPQSLNLYSYVQNNPTTVGDPDGHDSDPCGCQFNWQSWNTFTDSVQWLGQITWGVIKFDASAVSNAVKAAAPGAMAGTDPIPGLGQTSKQNSNASSNTQGAQSAQTGQSTPADPNQGQSKDKTGAQDKSLSKSEVKNLEANTGKGAHEIKEEALGTDKNLSKHDIYKNKDGDIVVKPKGSSGPGEQTGYTTEHLKQPAPKSE
jgi:RHS repeat-associated protein